MMGSKEDWVLAKMGVRHCKIMDILFGSPKAFVKAVNAYGVQHIRNDTANVSSV